jgi:hypothetical protein
MAFGADDLPSTYQLVTSATTSGTDRIPAVRDPSGVVAYPASFFLPGGLGGVTLGIVAGATQTQAGATALTTWINRVDTNAAAGNGVKLPATASGVVSCIVWNNTALPIQVYGAGADTVNGQAAATGISQAPNSIAVYYSAVAGAWFAQSGLGSSGQYFTELAQDGLAAAGSTQATALQLAAQICKVTACAAGAGVRLIPSAAGEDMLVIVDKGVAAPCQVYGAGADTIDGVAAATGVTQMAGSAVLYVCTTAGAWQTNGLASGYFGSFPTQPGGDSLAAVNPGAQSTATQLLAPVNRVTTVPAAASGVKLPPTTGLPVGAALVIFVIDAHATNAINVYPATGDQINALGANVAFSVAATKSAQFLCTIAGQWHTILTA